MVVAEAKSLQLVGSLPSVIEAGTPFSLTFNVMDKDGVHLTDGTDSVVFGELQVAWENDTVLFYEKIDEEELVLFKEMVNTVKKLKAAKSATFDLLFSEIIFLILNNTVIHV